MDFQGSWRVRRGCMTTKLFVRHEDRFANHHRMLYFQQNQTIRPVFPRPAWFRLPLQFEFVGEWLSLVEHLVRDQGVGGSNPLSPTIFSPVLSIVYAAIPTSAFSVQIGTFGTTAGNWNPKPHRSATSLRNATSSLTLS